MRPETVSHILVRCAIPTLIGLGLGIGLYDIAVEKKAVEKQLHDYKQAHQWLCGLMSLSIDTIDDYAKKAEKSGFADADFDRHVAVPFYQVQHLAKVCLKGPPLMELRLTDAAIIQGVHDLNQAMLAAQRAGWPLRPLL